MLVLTYNCLQCLARRSITSIRRRRSARSVVSATSSADSDATRTHALIPLLNATNLPVTSAMHIPIPDAQPVPRHTHGPTTTPLLSPLMVVPLKRADFDVHWHARG
jgi:hypothetical protein